GVGAAAARLQTGQIPAGELTRFVLYSTFVAGAMGQAVELYSQVQKTVGASQRVREFLREHPEISLATRQMAPFVFNPPARLRGEVELQDVTFHYPSRPEVAVLTT